MGEVNVFQIIYVYLVCSTLQNDKNNPQNNLLLWMISV